MNLEKNWTWACDQLRTSNLSADNFKKILNLDGSTSEPAIGSGDTVQRIPCFDSCQLIITLESVRLNIGLPVVRTDGQCTVTWLPNFLGWVDLLSYGASREWSSAIVTSNKESIFQKSWDWRCNGVPRPIHLFALKRFLSSKAHKWNQNRAN